MTKSEKELKTLLTLATKHLKEFRLLAEELLPQPRPIAARLPEYNDLHPLKLK